MRRFLSIVGMPAGEIDEGIDRRPGQRAAARLESRLQEMGELVFRKRPERVGAGHLQQRCAAIVHRFAQQALA